MSEALPPVTKQTDQLNTQESGGEAFPSPTAPGELPLVQAGQPTSQMPTNVPASDPLQPDHAPMSGHDAQASPVGQGNPVAADQQVQSGMVQEQPQGQQLGEVVDQRSEAVGQHQVDPPSDHKQDPNPKDEAEQASVEGDDEEQHSDEHEKYPNDKDQPKSGPVQKANPPLPDSVRQIPRKLKTNRDLTHGQDPALNKHRV